MARISTILSQHIVCKPEQRTTTKTEARTRKRFESELHSKRHAYQFFHCPEQVVGRSLPRRKAGHFVRKAVAGCQYLASIVCVAKKANEVRSHRGKRDMCENGDRDRDTDTARTVYGAVARVLTRQPQVHVDSALGHVGREDNTLSAVAVLRNWACCRLRKQKQTVKCNGRSTINEMKNKQKAYPDSVVRVVFVHLGEVIDIQLQTKQRQTPTQTQQVNTTTDSPETGLCVLTLSSGTFVIQLSMMARAVHSASLKLGCSRAGICG